jgi:hypothetical protein
MLDFQKIKVKEREEAAKYLEGLKIAPENAKLDKKAKLKVILRHPNIFTQNFFCRI